MREIRLCKAVARQIAGSLGIGSMDLRAAMDNCLVIFYAELCNGSRDWLQSFEDNFCCHTWLALKNC